MDEIRGVYLFTKKRTSDHFVCASPPGHLIHFIVKGAIAQSCDDRSYTLKRGDVLWYFDNEYVKGECLEVPWQYYSVVFHAPRLAPPEYSRRLIHVPYVASLKIFANLYRYWHDPKLSAWERSLKCHQSLGSILLLFKKHVVSHSSLTVEQSLARMWWSVENEVRQNLSGQYPIDKLAKLGHTSISTISRACREALQTSPCHRVKVLRLEMAQGLLIYSNLRIGEISEKCGYERINEFSRDFQKFFKTAPTTFREKALLNKAGYRR